MEGVWGVERAVWECVCVLFQPSRSLPKVGLPRLVSSESKGHILEGEEKDEPTFFGRGGGLWLSKARRLWGQKAAGVLEGVLDRSRAKVQEWILDGSCSVSLGT